MKNNNGFFNSSPKGKTLKLFSFFTVALIAVVGGVVFMQGITASQVGNISSAVWDGPYSNLSLAEDLIPNGIFIDPTGTKMYITGYNGEIYQYVLSQPWNTSTAHYYEGSEIDVSAQDTLPAGIFFDTTGTKMFVVGRTTFAVYQYTLSTPWNLSTATWDGPNSNLSVTADDPSLSGIFFSSTGKKMFIVDYGNDFIYQYSLATAWDISTASYLGLGSDLFIDTEETLATGIFFNGEGKKMFIVGYGSGGGVFQYTLSQAWNTSTATWDGLSLSIAAQDSIPTGIFFNATGTKMFITGDTNNRVYQYTLPVCKKITFRSKGYFESHAQQWPALLPQTLGNETVSTTARVDQIFDRTTKLDKVKAPLLALKFNLKNFPEAASFLVPGENVTMTTLAAQADALLLTNPTTAQLTAMQDRLGKTTVTFNSCSI